MLRLMNSLPYIYLDCFGVISTILKILDVEIAAFFLNIMEVSYYVVMNMEKQN